MPAADAAFSIRNFMALGPELALAAAGLVVLLADLAFFRRWEADRRRSAVVRVAVAGAVAGLGVAVMALIARFDLYGLRDALNFAGIDFQGDAEAVLFHGTLAGDLATDLLNLALAALLVLVVWVSGVAPFTESWGEYFALLFWSTVGMMLLIAAEELVTVFVALELMTICLYLATAFEKGRRRSAEAGLKYFVYGSVSSALFLFGLSLVYGLTGSTQYYAIRLALKASSPEGMVGLAGNVAGASALLLLLVGLGFKIAAVPFHQWAPDVYEGAPAPVTAWVAAGSKLASVVALLKLLLNALGPWASGPGGLTSPGWVIVVAVLAAASMVYGNFAALAQTNYKRMLAYSSVAHAGYFLVGVAAAGVLPAYSKAAGSVLYYLIVYAFTTVGAFAVAAWLARDKGSDEIADLDGLARTHPVMATCLALLVLSLIGLPPLAGFFGKFYVFMDALDGSKAGRLTLLWVVVLGLLSSVVSAFYYLRVLRAVFLRPDNDKPLAAAPSAVSAAVGLATAVVVVFGVVPGPLLDTMRSAAVPMLAESSLIGLKGVNRKTEPVGPAKPFVHPKPGESHFAGAALGGSVPPSPPPPQAKEKPEAPPATATPPGTTALPAGVETKPADTPKE